MPRFSRRPIRNFKGSRRETSWFSIVFTTTVLDGVASLVASLNAAALAKRPFTVVRTHLFVQQRTDTIETGTQLGAVGMAIVSDQASAVGITAVPTPVVDLGSDLWYVHQILMLHSISQTAIGLNVPAGNTYDIDSKAMRKVNDDEDIILVAENSTLQNGMSVDIAGRFLVKES